MQGLKSHSVDHLTTHPEPEQVHTLLWLGMACVLAHLMGHTFPGEMQHILCLVHIVPMISLPPPPPPPPPTSPQTTINRPYSGIFSAGQATPTTTGHTSLQARTRQVSLGDERPIADNDDIDRQSGGAPIR